ncbi:hypothetical protein C0584_02440 [Candidatus Parcubacteria bacterium]|nr:MAG: hypothetical protein C0584_02440 [Candidatus Parcubacteria bacterium]
MLRYLRNLFLTFKNFFKKAQADNKSEALLGFDKKLVYSLSKSKIPTLKQLKYINKYLSKREALLIKFSILFILFSASFLGFRFYFTHLELTPVRGGEYIEGLIGSPKHINPLYASINDVDSDIASLVFSSLYKPDGLGGVEEDLVDSLEVSEDGKEYVIQIRQGVKWHDAKDLNVDDVIFTMETIIDSAFQSPLRSSLTGVEIEKIDEYKLKLILAQPYAAFKDLLTFGIMPAHLWEQLPADSYLLTELNLKPIGSGPYKFKRFLKENSQGKIISVELELNEEYYREQPYIEEITFKFYPNFEELLLALNENLIDAISYLPWEMKDQIATQNSINFHSLNLGQILTLSFNLKGSDFLEKKSTRQALLYAIDKNEIVEDVFGLSARTIDSPILPESFAYKNDLEQYTLNKDKVLELLNEDDWSVATITADDLIEEEDDDKTLEKEVGEGLWLVKEDEDNKKEYFVIRIAVVDSEKDLLVANKIASYWEEVGIRTIVEKHSIKEINSEIIRDRNYEALLFSQAQGYDPDVYAFWHSSQAVTGGLNLSNYANSEVDKLLGEARQTLDESERQKKYFEFQNIITDEVPAIFIGSPKYLYLQKKSIKNYNVTSIQVPSDRFSNISSWYINTGKKIIW